MTQPQLEVVAQAIYGATSEARDSQWSERSELFRGHYRFLAQAALDALQLTPETRSDLLRANATEPPWTVDESRLVSPWVAVPQQENRQ